MGSVLWYWIRQGSAIIYGMTQNHHMRYISHVSNRLIHVGDISWYFASAWSMMTCIFHMPSNIWHKPHLGRQLHFLSLKCSWSNAFRRCSNYIFTLDLMSVMSGFNGWRKDNCKKRRETSKFWDLARLMLNVWRYVFDLDVWSFNTTRPR